MLRPNHLLHVVAVFAAIIAASAAHADCIAISTVPYSISQSGSYCVTADLSVALTDGEAIAILASNVDLDFQGHQIKNTITPSSSARVAGVRLVSQSSLDNVTVHNGSLHLFSFGITNYAPGYNVQASNLTVDQMTITSSRFRAISLDAANLRITKNTISSVIGSNQGAVGIDLWCCGSVANLTASNRAVVQGNTISGVRVTAKNPDGTAASSYAVGIHVSGFPDILIRDNAVYGVMVPPTALDGSLLVGIQVDQMNGGDSYRIGGLIVQDNVVQNNSIYVRNSQTKSNGIMIGFPGDHAIVTGSTIIGMSTGINANNGSLPNTPAVLLLNNVITGATTPIIGGVTLPQ
jgi:hypothetical protein